MPLAVDATCHRLSHSPSTYHRLSHSPSTGDEVLTADVLVPLLTFIVIRAAAPRLYAVTRMLEDFISETDEIATGSLLGGWRPVGVTASVRGRIRRADGARRCTGAHRGLHARDVSDVRAFASSTALRRRAGRRHAARGRARRRSCIAFIERLSEDNMLQARRRRRRRRRRGGGVRCVTARAARGGAVGERNVVGAGAAARANRRRVRRCDGPRARRSTTLC